MGGDEQLNCSVHGFLKRLNCLKACRLGPSQGLSAGSVPGLPAGSRTQPRSPTAAQPPASELSDSAPPSEAPSDTPLSEAPPSPGPLSCSPPSAAPPSSRL